MRNKKQSIANSNMLFSTIASSPSKKSSRKNQLMLLWQMLFHYSDAFSDMNTIIVFYTMISKQDNQQSGNGVLFLIIPILGLIMDRVTSYKLTKQFFKKRIVKQKSGLQQSAILKSNQIKDAKIPIKKHILIIILTILYSEQLLFWNLIGKEKGVSKYIFLRKVQELCFENMIMLAIGIVFYSRSFMEDVPISFLEGFQIFTSGVSCISVLYQLYLLRILQEPFQIKKQLSDFYSFPKEVQLMISNPTEAHFLKQFNKINKPLFIHFKVPKKSQQKMISQYKDKDGKFMLGMNLGIMKKMLIILYISVTLIGQIMIMQMQVFTEKVITFQQFLLFGLIYVSPQVIIHLKVYKQMNTTLDFIKYTLKTLTIKLPFIACFSIMNFKVPLGTFEIPFIAQTRTTWTFSIIPTKISILLSILACSYITYITYDVVLGDANMNEYVIGLKGRVVKGKGSEFFAQNGQFFWWNFYIFIGLSISNILLQIGSLLYFPRVTQQGYQGIQEKDKIQQSEVGVLPIKEKQDGQYITPLKESQLIIEQIRDQSPTQLLTINTCSSDKQNLKTFVFSSNEENIDKILETNPNDYEPQISTAIRVLNYKNSDILQ